MRDFIQSLCGKPTSSSSRHRRTSIKGSQRRLSPEMLEPRAMMAANISISGGDLVINGTEAAEDITVSKLSGYYQYQVTEKSIINGVPATTTRVFNVTGGDVIFNGFGGHDKFSANNTVLRVTANGGAGNDVILGSGAVDNLRGGEGHDTLRGGPGADFLYGEGGNDNVNGGTDNDVVDGGNGVDYLYGESGDDTINAGLDASANYLYGSFGKDTMTGGNGSDTMYGGDGDDMLKGGLGSDYLYGENGNDSISVGDSNDFSYNFAQGGAGNDILRGGSGGDVLNGNSGNDIIRGLGGSDRLYSGSGQDYLYGGDGDDQLHGNCNNDNYTRFRGQAGYDTFFIDFGGYLWPWDDVPVLDMDAEPGEQWFDVNA